MKLANKEIFPTFNAFYTPLFRREWHGNQAHGKRRTKDHTWTIPILVASVCLTCVALGIGVSLNTFLLLQAVNGFFYTHAMYCWYKERVRWIKGKAL
jgi:hypothetical protein